MKRWVGISVLVLVVHLGGLQTVGLAEEEPFYKQATRAVFRLQVHRSVCTAGKTASQELLQPAGTGFFVQDFMGQEPMLWVITARHVVAASDADLFAKVRLGAENPKDVWLRLPREKWYSRRGSRLGSTSQLPAVVTHDVDDPGHRDQGRVVWPQSAMTAPRRTKRRAGLPPRTDGRFRRGSRAAATTVHASGAPFDAYPSRRQVSGGVVRGKSIR